MGSAGEQQDQRSAGSLAAAISRHTVRVAAEYTGRGPTQAKASIRDNVVVVLAMDNMTKGEHRLVGMGEADTVTSVRRKFQAVMRDDLVAGVELLTGRQVVSFLSDHNAETDHAIEVFVLDAPPDRGREVDES